MKSCGTCGLSLTADQDICPRCSGGYRATTEEPNERQERLDRVITLLAYLVLYQSLDRADYPTTIIDHVKARILYLARKVRNN